MGLGYILQHSTPTYLRMLTLWIKNLCYWNKCLLNSAFQPYLDNPLLVRQIVYLKRKTFKETNKQTL